MSIGLGSALKALSAARAGIQTAGQNISNANTPGYSRQRIVQSADVPFVTVNGFQIGTGVSVRSIHSIVDENLEARLRGQISLSFDARVDFTQWDALESVFNEPGAGLSGDISSFFDQIAQLQNDPSSRALRSGMVQGGRTLALNMNLLSNNMQSMQTSLFNTIDTLAQQVNQYSAAISELNTQVLASEAGGSRANDLRDSREQLIKQMAEIVDLRVIEHPNGAVDVLTDGAALVKGDRWSALDASRGSSGKTELTVGSSTRLITPNGGQIAALLRHETIGSAAIQAEMDRFAFNMAFEFNKLQTTGVPLAGSFDSLKSYYGIADIDGDGNFGDELVGAANLPFQVQKGELYVTTTDKTTGAVERAKIDIDPAITTVSQLVSRLDAISHVTASLDPTGRIRVQAATGYGFDFASRLDAQPDAFGSFGGASPSAASATAGPFNLGAALSPGPATFTANIDGTNYAVSMAASEFSNPAKVTTDELVAAINADLGTAGTAKNVGERLVIRSNSTGTSATLQLTDGAGTPLSTLGITTGTTRTGEISGVDPAVFGKYTGTTNGQLTFIPDSDGMIGVTAGLTVGVFDTAGTRVATLDVGSNYQPSSHLDVADGIKVSFGPGQISATFKDVFALDTIADADTSDILVALGMNSLFLGTTASNIEMNPDLLNNSDLLATGLSGAVADPDNIIRMVQLRNSQLSALDNQSLEDFYSNIVGDLGFQSAASQAAVSAQDQLLARLQLQRDSVSGVSLDEEMVDMVRFQQAFQAASRLVDAINQMTDTLLALGR